jgi:hypothetical protein
MKRGELNRSPFFISRVVGAVLALLIAANVVSISHGKGFSDMPVNCLAALVAVIGGKVAQNFTEK